MNKTILITGSTDGIGKLAAIQLAKEGHQIYLHGRSQQKLTTVIAEVRAASNNSSINGFVADFSDLEAVKQMAQAIKTELSKIDVLINNAGVFKGPSTNKDGFDLRFVVNYLAPYLLTSELIPLLKQAEAPRILNLSSAAQAPVSLEALSGNAPLSAQASYAQSKLALTMWSFHLAKAHPDLAVIAVNPGSLLNTNMVREAYGRYWSSADKGANILFDLAVSQQYEGLTDQYYDNDKACFDDAHPEAYNKEAIQKLIISIMIMTKLALMMRIRKLTTKKLFKSSLSVL